MILTFPDWILLAFQTVRTKSLKYKILFFAVLLMFNIVYDIIVDVENVMISSVTVRVQ